MRGGHRAAADPVLHIARHGPTIQPTNRCQRNQINRCNRTQSKPKLPTKTTKQSGQPMINQSTAHSSSAPIIIRPNLNRGHLHVEHHRGRVAGIDAGDVGAPRATGAAAGVPASAARSEEPGSCIPDMSIEHRDARADTFRCHVSFLCWCVVVFCFFPGGGGGGSTRITHGPLTRPGARGRPRFKPKPGARVRRTSGRGRSSSRRGRGRGH